MNQGKFISNADYLTISGMSLSSALASANTEKEFSYKFEPSYSGFDEFIFFGSARNVTQLAVDKIIETYPISTTSVTASSFQFEQYQKYNSVYTQFERKVLSGFTNTVTGVYNGSSFEIVNIPKNSDGSLFDINDVNYIDGILEEGFLYDQHNINMLQGFVPHMILEYDENDVMTNLMNMFGQVFDEIMLYSNQFGSMFNVTNNYGDYDRPRSYDAFNLLNMFGYKAHSIFLFSSIYEYLISTNTKFSEKAIQMELWNRILANLIFLYKSKGTFECIKAFLNVLGLNTDLINIKEYVNFEKPAYIKTTKTINYFRVHFDDTVSGNITSTGSGFNLTGDEWSIVYNFSMGNKVRTQSLFGRENQFGASIIDTSVSSDYNEPILKGYASFTANTGAGSVIVNSSESSDIFNNVPKTLIVTKSLTSYSIQLSYLSLDNIAVKVGGSSSVSSNIISSTTGTFYLGRSWEDNTNSFVGNGINFKIFNKEFDDGVKEKYHTHLDLINITNESVSSDHVIVNWDLNEPLKSSYRINEFASITADEARIILDSSTGFSTGTNTGYANFLSGARYSVDQIIIPTEKYVSGLVPYSDKINFGKPLYKNTNLISLDISPSEILNNSFEYFLGPIDFYDYFLSSDLDSDGNKYKGLEILKDKFYNTNIKIKDYSNLFNDVESYAVGLFKSFYQFLPASAKLLYMGVVIESPIYDRNKHIIRNLDFDTLTATPQRQDITIGVEESMVVPLVGNMASITSIDGYSVSAISGSFSITSISGSLINPSVGTHEFDSELSESEYLTTADDTLSYEFNLAYLQYNNDIFNSFIQNDDIVSPLDTTVSETFDILVGGHQTIYLSRSLTGETDLVFKYEDIQGDNIVGTRFQITQNTTEPKSKFEVIDNDSGLTANTKTKTYYMLDYDGANFTFRFKDDDGIPDTDKEYEIIKNYIRIKNIRKEFNIKIKWIPDSKIVYTPILINDSYDTEIYPLVRWNLSTEIDTITATYSDYGGTLTSDFYTTSADFVAGSGVSILFNNYNKYVDAELAIRFTLTGQSNSFVLETVDNVNEDRQVGTELSVGAYLNDEIVFFKDTENIRRFRLPKTKTKKIRLRMANTVTAYTSGEVTFYTNQPKDDSTNKTFLLRFFADPSNFVDEGTPVSKYEDQSVV